jgi:hypothetical protein
MEVEAAQVVAVANNNCGQREEAMDEESFKKLSVAEQNAEIGRLYDRNRQNRYLLAVKVVDMSMWMDLYCGYWK